MNTELHFVCFYGHPLRINNYLSSELSDNQVLKQNIDGETILHILMTRNDIEEDCIIEIIKKMINKGLSINTVNNQKRIAFPVNYSCIYDDKKEKISTGILDCQPSDRQKKIIYFLLENGIDLNSFIGYRIVQEEDECTRFVKIKVLLVEYIVKYFGGLSVFQKYFPKLDVFYEEKDSKNKISKHYHFFNYLLQNGELEIIKYMIEMGYCVNEIFFFPVESNDFNNFRMTPFANALLNKKENILEIVELLFANSCSDIGLIEFELHSKMSANSLNCLTIFSQSMRTFSTVDYRLTEKLIGFLESKGLVISEQLHFELVNDVIYRGKRPVDSSHLVKFIDLFIDKCKNTKELLSAIRLNDQILCDKVKQRIMSLDDSRYSNPIELAVQNDSLMIDYLLTVGIYLEIMSEDCSRWVVHLVFSSCDENIIKKLLSLLDNKINNLSFMELLNYLSHNKRLNLDSFCETLKVFYATKKKQLGGDLFSSQGEKEREAFVHILITMTNFPTFSFFMEEMRNSIYIDSDFVIQSLLIQEKDALFEIKDIEIFKYICDPLRGIYIDKELEMGSEKRVNNCLNHQIEKIVSSDNANLFQYVCEQTNRPLNLIFKNERYITDIISKDSIKIYSFLLDHLTEIEEYQLYEHVRLSMNHSSLKIFKRLVEYIVQNRIRYNIHDYHLLFKKLAYLSVSNTRQRHIDCKMFELFLNNFDGIAMTREGGIGRFHSFICSHYFCSHCIGLLLIKLNVNNDIGTKRYTKSVEAFTLLDFMVSNYSEHVEDLNIFNNDSRRFEMERERLIVDTISNMGAVSTSVGVWRDDLFKGEKNCYLKMRLIEEFLSIESTKKQLNFNEFLKKYFSPREAMNSLQEIVQFKKFFSEEYIQVACDYLKHYLEYFNGRISDNNTLKQVFGMQHISLLDNDYFFRKLKKIVKIFNIPSTAFSLFLENNSLNPSENKEIFNPFDFILTNCKSLFLELVRTKYFDKIFIFFLSRGVPITENFIKTLIKWKLGNDQTQNSSISTSQDIDLEINGIFTARYEHYKLLSTELRKKILMLLFCIRTKNIENVYIPKFLKMKIVSYYVNSILSENVHGRLVNLSLRCGEKRMVANINNQNN